MLSIRCRSCDVVLASVDREMTVEEWRAMESVLYGSRVPIVDENLALHWINELWNDDNMYLPWPTDSWVIAPDAFAATGAVQGTMGCCGFAPRKHNEWFKNQLCTCGVELGWLNTDCLGPEFLVFDPAAVLVATR